MPLSRDLLASMRSMTPLDVHYTLPPQRHADFVLRSDIEHIWQNGYRMGFYRGGPILMSALAGIDIALWDLKGENDLIETRHEVRLIFDRVHFIARRFNVPIYELLGGKVRDQLRVYAWIGGDRPGDVEVQA